ncbi:hypothetical protein M949_1895 [Riemerella anatipestifer CH3]|nr:hypothetical protein M949_1895 [Riemerella anatipestifer CH3]
MWCIVIIRFILGIMYRIKKVLAHQITQRQASVEKAPNPCGSPFGGISP